ncbi:hypothetical protein BJY01DRAFT_247774 [Aspergillus pseudoustus]|uniref:C2H2-type domain-containing protein n=1 Tax=Aspergillus pseudoustus TaxID=1810923 RepID=A0ABR4JZ00_9EURO
MHWVNGTWLWAKHRANHSTSSPIYLEPRPSTNTRANPRTRENRPRTWSLPTYNHPQDAGHARTTSGLGTPAGSGSRSRSDSSVTTSSRGTQTGSAAAAVAGYGVGAGLPHPHPHPHPHPRPPPLCLHCTESYSYTSSAASTAAGGPPFLCCIRCGRYRSRTYHYLHFDDPVTYPEYGICSRERTDCAKAKAREQLAAEKEVEMEGRMGVGFGFGFEHEGDMGDMQDMRDVYELPDTSTESMETSSLC